MGVTRATDEGQRPLLWLLLLSFLETHCLIASFLHPGGSNTTQGKEELKQAPEGRHSVIREVETRTEPKSWF